MTRADRAKVYKTHGWMNQMYTVDELSTTKIASIAGCSASTIFRWLKRLEIKVRTQSEAESGTKNPNYGKHHPEKTRQKISKSLQGKTASDETKQKMSEARKGRTYTEKTLHRMSEARMGEKNPMYGKPVSNETRKKISNAQRGKKNNAWRGGISFEPYCYKFSPELKEDIRGKHGRKCVVCGAEENGRKHDVHHTTYNKMEGCDTEDWHLVPLCRSCHMKTNHNRWHWFGLLYNNWATNPAINFQPPELV